MTGTLSESTAAAVPECNQTYLQVCSYFEGGTVLLTGASGFVGAVILEQLLRLTDVQRVYVLTRPKAGSDPAGRVRQLLSSRLFQHVQSPALLRKVEAIPGDISQPNLGITDALISKLTNEVDTIIHSAANISLAPHIHRALRENYVATESLLNIAKACTRLRSFVFLSSAFANGNQPDGAHVMEQLYDIPCTDGKAPDPCAVANEWLSLPPDTAAAIAKTQLDQWGWPNGYQFSKFAAEHLVIRYKTQHHVPVAIIRPSYIGPTAYKPMPGYCGNMAAGMGIAATIVMGLFSSTDGFAMPPHVVLDHIPADVVGYACLAAAALAAANNGYDSEQETLPAPVSSTVRATDSYTTSTGQYVATQPTPHLQDRQHRVIFHVSSSNLNELSWAEWYGYIFDYVQKNPRHIVVEPHLPPKFSTSGYVPCDSQTAAHNARMARLVSDKCESLRSQGRMQDAQTVQHVWKLYNILHTPKLGTRHIFDNTNAQWLEGRLSPGDKGKFQLTWRNGNDLSWKEYIPYLVQGTYDQLYGEGKNKQATTTGHVSKL